MVLTIGAGRESGRDKGCFGVVVVAVVVEDGWSLGFGLCVVFDGNGFLVRCFLYESIEENEFEFDFRWQDGGLE